MFRHVRQTSPGEPQVGTTYLEETTQGPQPGEIVELEAPQKGHLPLVGRVQSREAQVRRLARLLPRAGRRERHPRPPPRQAHHVRHLPLGCAALQATGRPGAHHHDRRAQSVVRAGLQSRGELTSCNPPTLTVRAVSRRRPRGSTRWDQELTTPRCRNSEHYAPLTCAFARSGCSGATLGPPRTPSTADFVRSSLVGIRCV